MKKRKKTIKFWLLIIIPLFILIGGALFFIQKTNGNLQEDLNTTGNKISNLINQINLLASQSNDQLGLIQAKQKGGDVKAALDLVIIEKEHNRQINESSIQLTEELKKLTQLLLKVSDVAEQEKIETAIQYQVNAISHLLNYGAGVDALLQELALQYESALDNRTYEPKENIDELYALIQQEIATANTNSQKFLESLAEVKNEEN
ncbi:MAG TPA: hypothetical protein PKZ02_00200 [Candidatus Paceibacterota bacterium]|nr:hypothetical protein [Candidatus Paceibacterota bacterium]HRY76794.1 hypothetical protein [Candidatus Paceibacterota bacterium]